MIRIGTIAPDRLNLNGDQANILALTRFLRAAGFEVSVVPVSNTEQALACHFLLFGHGSAAAMTSIEALISNLDFQSILTSVPGLAVGSGFERLSSAGLVAQSIAQGPRQSEFSIGELGPLKVLGYRNTDSGLPNLVLNNAWMCSMLHGPLLAKNPALLARAARAAVAAAGLAWPTTPSRELQAWVEQLNLVCERIWKLESDEAYPELSL